MTPQEISAHNKAIAAKLVALQEQEKALYSEAIPPVAVGETVAYNHGKATTAIIQSVKPYLSNTSLMFIGTLAIVRKDGTLGQVVKFRASDYIGFVQDKFKK